MTKVAWVDPFRCRVWDGHERLEELINEQTCREEIESVQRHGQMIPVLARPLKADPQHQYEVVYGARRLFVARHLNRPLLAEVRELCDREAVLALEIENRLRKELSPYERGRHYKAWLRAGTFTSQDELARALNVSASQVSRLLKLAQMPTVLVKAFASPLEICERWGSVLMDLWKDPQKQSKLVACARALATETPRPAAPVVYQRLLSSPATRNVRALYRNSDGEHEEVVRDVHGRPLFRVRAHQNDIAFLLPVGHLSDDALGEIKSQIAAILLKTRPATTPVGHKHGLCVEGGGWRERASVKGQSLRYDAPSSPGV